MPKTIIEVRRRAAGRAALIRYVFRLARLHTFPSQNDDGPGGQGASNDAVDNRPLQ